jgi:hypothetical protein
MAIAPDTSWDGPHPARPVLGAVTTALDALADSTPQRLWALGDGEVTEAFTLLARMRASADAHLVAVLAEAKTRGLGSGDGWGPLDWARAMAPQLPTRTLGDLDTLAAAMVATSAGDVRLTSVLDAVAEAATATAAAVDGHAGDDGADVDGAEEDGADDNHADEHGADEHGADEHGADDESVHDVGHGALAVGRAAQIVRFHRSIRALAEADHLAELTSITLRAARGPRALSEKGLATALRHAANELRPDRLVEHDADLRRAHRSLIKGPGPLGLSRYTLLMDDEGAAILDTAVDALAKPQKVTSPDDGTPQPDPRTPAARRADALLELVTRAVSSPDGTPRQAKTTLIVTTTLATLTRQARGAGLTLAGELLTTDTVRRLACDAELIPMVLGSGGQVLDHGKATRLFTPAQARHLWLRDGGCTFPGCTRPPTWTDAHHLVHWADGGPTNLDNAALLCPSHHTVVHRHRYTGAVVDTRTGPEVQWDLTPGAYDHHLEALRQIGTIPRWPDPADDRADDPDDDPDDPDDPDDKRDDLPDDLDDPEPDDDPDDPDDDLGDRCLDGHDLDEANPEPDDPGP